MALSNRIIAGRALVLIEAIDKTGKVFSKVQKRFSRLGNRIKTFQKEGVKGFDLLRRSISFLAAPLHKLQTNFAALGKFASFAFARAANRLKALGMNLRNLGFQIAFTAGLLILPLVSSVKEAAKLETELLKAKAAAQLTNEEFLRLEKTIKRTSRATTFVPTEIATVAKELARAGLKGNVLEAAILPVLTASRATDADPTKFAEQFVQAITTFKLGVEDYESVADNFVTASNESIVDMEDLAASFSFVAGSANATRLGLTKTLAALSQLSFSGIIGSKGGTSLNQFLITLGQKAPDIEKSFGISTFDSAGQLRNPLDILIELGKVLKELPDERKLPNLTRIFNVRGGRAVQALTENLENLESMIERMEVEVGIATKQAKILDEGFEGSFRRIARSLVLLKTAIGESFREPLANLARLIEKVVDKLIPWIEANEKVIVQVGKFLVGTVALGGAMIILGGALGAVALGLNQIGILAGAFFNIMSSLMTVLGLTAGAAAIATAQILGGIILVVGAIALLIHLVKDSLVKAFGPLVGTAVKVFTKISNSIRGLFKQLVRFWNNLKVIIELILHVPLLFIATFSRVILTTTGLLLRAVISVFTTTLRLINMSIEALLFFGNIIGKAILLPFLLAAKSIEGWGIALRFVWNTLKNITNLLKTNFLKKFNITSRELKILWENIKGIIAATFSIAIEPIQKVFSTLVQLMRPLGAIIEMFRRWLRLLDPINFATAIFNTALIFLNGALENMILGLELLEQLFVAPFVAALDAVKKLSKELEKFTGENFRKNFPFFARVLEGIGLIDPTDKPKTTDSLAAEKLRLLEEQAALKLGAATVTASSITIQKGSVADIETSFKDQQQAVTISLLQAIEQRLEEIKQNQIDGVSFGGI